METQDEFLKRRKLDQSQADLDSDRDPLIRAFFGPFERVPITRQEFEAYCLPTDWMLKRQAD
jgi:hypothetical protein